MTTTVTRWQKLNVRPGRAAALGLLALAAVLCQAREAAAQWTTSGANTTTTNNVGVGTTAPAAKVHVVGADGANDYTSAPAPDAFFTIGGKGGNGNWNASAGGVGGALKLQGGKGGAPVAGSSVTGFGGLGGAVHITGGIGGDNPFAVRAGHGGSVFINGGDIGTSTAGGALPGHVILANVRGNVGVGTDAPSTKLHVAGQVRSSSGGFVFPDGTVQSTAAVSGTTSSNLAASQVSAGHFGANVGGGVFSFPSSVGFGTTSPGHRLHVVSTAGQEGVIVDAATYPEVRFDRGGVPKAYIGVAGAAGGYAAGTLADSVAVRAENALHLISNGGTVGVTVNGGNVGLGTTAPAQKLDVRGSVLIEAGANPNLFTGAAAAEHNRYLQLLNAPGLQSASGLKAGGVLVSDSYAYANPGKNDLIVKGNVGIGIAAPTAKLHVAGSITVDGNINAKYQDVAEWVPSTQKLAAGTVVILDPERSNQVLASAGAYDTAVAGVISAQPGLSLGEAGEGKVLVATTGRVKVRVDATRAPIKIGDLLVTSDVEGVAMKSEPVTMRGRKFHSPGTIIGKALEPLAGRVGEILVLLSLQ